jgi:TnpA family transposase
MHHTDGGGVSDHVFALMYLLGYLFAPRIPNLAERRLYAFRPASNWPELAPFIAGAIEREQGALDPTDFTQGQRDF